MDWYKLIRTISTVGGICSLIITFIAIVLILSLLRSKRYTNKIVAETPLLKYLKVLTVGGILTIIFQTLKYLVEVFR
jgi:hypothetical protein